MPQKPVRVFLIRKNIALAAGALLAAVAIFCAVNVPAAITAAGSARQLPIYCVDRSGEDGKKYCSISFDAAWGNEDTQMLIDILAKYDVKAGFEITPIEKLTVGLDWHFRSGRNAVYCFKADGVDLYGYDAELRSLGIVNDLGLHAAYRISDALTVSANLQNLMCRRWQLVQGVDSPRLNGLLGVSYKF